MIQFIQGQRIYLRALEAQDAEGNYPVWLNDEEACAGNSHHVFPYVREKAQAYIEKANRASDSLILAMVLQESNQHIGNIALQEINWIYKTAELAVLLGEKEHWGKGYSLEAAKLLMTHGFNALNLNRIYCGTFETNVGMQKLAKSLGMKQEGVRRKAVYKNGNYLDLIEFGLLREEFTL